MKNFDLKQELAYFFGALRFFTRLPVPAWVGHDSEALDHAARYFPAVGLLLGMLAALTFATTSFFWPKTLAVLAAIAITIYWTGAFHEDGWGDMVDGFGGGREKAQILTIMKDSRLGSFGAVALILLLLARFCALIELEAHLIAATLIAGHTLSRFCATAVMRGLDYVRDEGKAKPLATRISGSELAVALLTTLLALALPAIQVSAGQVALGAAFAALATFWLARLFLRRIGGYTGDCLGAVQQLSEVAFYGGLLCRFT